MPRGVLRLVPVVFYPPGIHSCARNALGAAQALLPPVFTDRGAPSGVRPAITCRSAGVPRLPNLGPGALQRGAEYRAAPLASPRGEPNLGLPGGRAGRHSGRRIVGQCGSRERSSSAHLGVIPPERVRRPPRTPPNLRPRRRPRQAPWLSVLNQASRERLLRLRPSRRPRPRPRRQGRQTRWVIPVRSSGILRVVSR